MTTVQLLDSKRAYGINIMLGRLKHTFAELREAVFQLDDTMLTEQLLKQFLNFVPTAEELALLNDHHRNNSNSNGNGEVEMPLGRPELFFLEMGRVPGYEQRLRAMLFRATFAERYADVREEIRVVLEASRAIRDSKNLHSLLEASDCDIV